MNKRLTLLVTIIAAIALGGLLAVQFYWVKNAIEVQSQRFNQEVNSAVSEAVKTMEKQEAEDHLKNAVGTDSLSLESIDSILFKSMPNKNISVIIQDSITRQGQGGKSGAGSTYEKRVSATITATSAGTGKNKMLFIQKTRTDSGNGMIETLDTIMGNPGRNSDQKEIKAKLEENIGLIRQVAMNMMLSQKKPSERLNKEKIQTALATELGNRSMNLPFVFGVMEKCSEKLALQSDSNHASELLKSPYRTTLFHGSMGSAPMELTVFFPGKKSFLLKKTGAALGISLLFMLLILGVFLYMMQVIRSQKKLSDMKTDFINNMTHEFKTPVSTILLASEGLKDPLITKDQQQVHRLAGIIYEENQRIGSQVERVLQLASMEKGSFKIATAPTNIHELIGKVSERFSMQVKNRNGSIVTELLAKDPVIQADALHLSNAISNLVDNAIKYCDKEPMITILAEDAENGIRILVKDNGIGMSAEQQHKIFDKFYRVPTGNLHDVKGFGLGLSYVKAIAEAHQGSVSVKSEKGKGSLFSMYFPRKTDH